MTNPVRDWPETSYYNIGTLSETVIAFRPNSILEVGGWESNPRFENSYASDLISSVFKSEADAQPCVH
jgi:hypothetical protein